MCHGPMPVDLCLHGSQQSSVYVCMYMPYHLSACVSGMMFVCGGGGKDGVQPNCAISSTDLKRIV